MKKTIIIARVGLVLLSALILLPILFTFLYSVFSPEEMIDYLNMRSQYSAGYMEIKLLPRSFSFAQYEQILFHDPGLLHYYKNSIIYSFSIIIGQLLIVPAMAYALSRFIFPLRDTLNFILIILFLLPFQVTMVSNVLTLRKLGLMNTMWAVILPEAASPFYIFLLRQNMLSIPEELYEAAQIDGAGPIRCYLSITLPVSLPVLATMISLSFADSWNLVEQPLAYLTKRHDLYPLSLLFNQFAQTANGYEFAGAALYLLPALFVYQFFQDDITSGLQLSELK